MDQELVEYLERRFQESDRKTEELFRQTQVMVEDLRSQVQLVAEGVVGQQQQLDGFRKEVAEEFQETKALIKLSYAELDQRIKGLELKVTTLDQRLTALENAA